MDTQVVASHWKQVTAAVAVTLIVCGVIFASWLQAHDAKLLMQQTIHDKDAEIAAVRKENDALKANIQKQPIQQVIKYVPQIIKVGPNVPEPTPIPVPNQLTQEEVAKLPDAPSVLTPEPTFRGLMAQAADDLACRKELDACNVKFQAAVKAAKGGGFWQRLKGNSKFLFIGAVSGAVATVALKH